MLGPTPSGAVTGANVSHARHVELCGVQLRAHAGGALELGAQDAACEINVCGSHAEAIVDWEDRLTVLAYQP